MLVAAAYLGLALVLTSIWFNSGSRFNSYARAEFVDLIEGTGYRPFVHRLLVPAVVRGARALVGEGTRERLIDAHPVFLELGTRYEFEDPSYGFELVLCFAVWYLAMAGFLFGMRAVARALYERPGSTADLVPLVAAFSLPMFFAEGAHYLYDPTDLPEHLVHLRDRVGADAALLRRVRRCAAEQGDRGGLRGIVRAGALRT